MIVVAILNVILLFSDPSLRLVLFKTQSCALIVGVEEGIWQVDPTGQFWSCRVAVAGRGADKARNLLLETMASKLNATDSSAITHTQVESLLQSLSVQDAVQLVSKCLQSATGPAASSADNGNETTTSTPPRPLVALTIKKMKRGNQRVEWYSSKDLLERVDDAKESTTT